MFRALRGAPAFGTAVVVCASFFCSIETGRADEAPTVRAPTSFWSLAVHGEARQRLERFENVSWDRNNGSDLFLLQKYRVSAALRIGPRLRIATALKSGLEHGRKGGPRPTDEDRLDVHEAFVEIVVSPRSSTLFGRRELAFGSQRLVSVRGSPNVRQSFDGVSIAIHHGPWSLDAFAVRPVRTDPGVLDDAWDKSRTFWGAYVVGPIRIFDRAGVDLYYLGLDRESARYDQGTSKERRHSAGMRLWRAAKPFDYNFELVYQWGRFGQGAITAWTIASDTGFTLEAVAGRPRFGVKADITSGDRDPQEPALQTFNPLFPKGSYFGENQVLGPVNHVDVHPSVDFHPCSWLTVNPSWSFFWRQSLHDGTYGVPGNLVRSGQATRARYIGSQIALGLLAAATRRTTVGAIFERFVSGPFLRESGPGDDIEFFAFWISYAF